ncbi:MAG: tetratricopeptide repeat protein [Planctomycetaceae bacterium]
MNFDSPFPVRFSLSTGLLAVCVSIVGCTRGDNPEVTFERGRILADRGRFDDAIPLYDKALEKLSDRPEVYYERGRAFENLGDPQLLERAAEDYNKALSLNSDLAQAINNKGVVLARLERFAEAADVFGQLIQADSADILALRNRGLCYHDVGDFEKALADYDKAIELAASDPINWFQRGNVYLDQDRFADAVADYTKAIELDPEYAKAWMNRGVALFSMNKRDDAMKDLLQAQSLDDSIVLPTIDWLTIGTPSLQAAAEPTASVPESGERSAGKPIIPETAVGGDWSEVLTVAQEILARHGFTDLKLRSSVPTQLCGRFAAMHGNDAVDVYLGVMTDQSTEVVLPAIASGAGAARQSLLVLSFGETDQTFQEARFVNDWTPDSREVVPQAVKVRLPER